MQGQEEETGKERGSNKMMFTNNLKPSHLVSSFLLRVFDYCIYEEN